MVKYFRSPRLRFTSKYNTTTKILIIVSIVIILFLVIFLPIYYLVIKPSSGNSLITPSLLPILTIPESNTTISPSDSKAWIDKLYTQINWINAPTSSLTSNTNVSTDWINWANNSNNSILQYYVNYRRTTQGQLNAGAWPTTDENIVLNPVYSWDGLGTAIYIWNYCVELNNNDTSHPLGVKLAGFCNESELVKRQMTIAAFLGNATVESAYFLVCKESTTLSDNDNTNCPGNGASFNPRYFNNCDNGNPMTYSCQGNSGGGGGGGVCAPKQPFSNVSVCNTTGCSSNNTSLCNVSGDGATWVSWDSTIVRNQEQCDSKKNTYKYTYWCPQNKPTPTPTPIPTPTFNPTKDNCTGGWPQCEFPGSDGIFINLPPQDPCMLDPYAEGDSSGNNKLDNDKPTCSDWNGNPWKQQQECYFGRGLIQLTWSCNYYQAQRMLRLMASLLTKSSGDPVLQQFKNSIEAKPITNSSINLCANPDMLCGNYTIDKTTAKITYSDNIIERAIPWLSCIIYWATKCAPAFNTCYSFLAAYQGIAPSGSGEPADRLRAMKFLMTIMGEDLTNTKIFNSTTTDLNLAKYTCGGGGSGGGGQSYCGYAWDDPRLCRNKNKCSSDTDCTQQSDKCWANIPCN